MENFPALCHYFFFYTSTGLISLLYAIVWSNYCIILGIDFASLGHNLYLLITGQVDLPSLYSYYNVSIGDSNYALSTLGGQPGDSGLLTPNYALSTSGGQTGGSGRFSPYYSLGTSGQSGGSGQFPTQSLPIQPHSVNNTVLPSNELESLYNQAVQDKTDMNVANPYHVTLNELKIKAVETGSPIATGTNPNARIDTVFGQYAGPIKNAFIWSRIGTLGRETADISSCPYTYVVKNALVADGL